MSEALKTDAHSLEVEELPLTRLPLSENPPSRKLTRKHIEHLNQAYWWLNEYGDDYIEEATALKDVHYFCQRILDIEAGIKQGYLDGETKLPKVV